VASCHGPPQDVSRFATVWQQWAFVKVDMGLLAIVSLRYGKWCQYLFVVPKYHYQCPYSTIIHEP
jgi:hypothetical protein